MYYEEAEVKRYYRKNSEGEKIPYFQINLKKSSKFNEAKPVALVDISEIEEIEKNSDNSRISEIEAELSELRNENHKLKEELAQSNEVNEKLTSENTSFKNEISELQKNLLKAESKNEEIIKLQRTHKQELENKNDEIQKLNSMLNHEKDLTKTLLVVRNDLLTRGLISRIRNREPESSKLVAEIKPIELEVKNTKKK